MLVKKQVHKLLLLTLGFSLVLSNQQKGNQMEKTFDYRPNIELANGRVLDFTNQNIYPSFYQNKFLKKRGKTHKLLPFPNSKFNKYKLKKILKYLKKNKFRHPKMSKNLKKYLKSYRRYLRKAKRHFSFAKELKKQRKRLKNKAFRKYFIKRKTKPKDSKDDQNETKTVSKDDNSGSYFNLDIDDDGSLKISDDKKKENNKGDDKKFMNQLFNEMALNTSENKDKTTTKKEETTREEKINIKQKEENLSFGNLFSIGDNDEDEDKEKVTDGNATKEKDNDSSADFDEFLMNLQKQENEKIKKKPNIEKKKPKSDQEDILNNEIQALFNKSVKDDNSNIDIDNDKNKKTEEDSLGFEFDDIFDLKSKNNKTKTSSKTEDSFLRFMNQLENSEQSNSSGKSTNKKRVDKNNNKKERRKRRRRRRRRSSRSFKRKVKKKIKKLEKEMHRIKKTLSIFKIDRKHPLLNTLGMNSLSSLNYNSGTITKPQLLYFLPRNDLTHHGKPAYDYIYETVDKFHNPHFASFRIGYDLKSKSKNQDLFPTPMYFGENYKSALSFLNTINNQDIKVGSKNPNNLFQKKKGFSELITTLKGKTPIKSKNFYENARAKLNYFVNNLGS
jgi:hypothetical protein